MKTRIKVTKVELVYSTKTDGFKYNINSDPFDIRPKDWKLRQLFKDVVPVAKE